MYGYGFGETFCWEQSLTKGEKTAFCVAFSIPNSFTNLLLYYKPPLEEETLER